MKFRLTSFPFFLYILLFASVLAFAGETTFASHSEKKAEAASTEANDRIEGATVNLYCRLKAGKNIIGTTGSGVFIDDVGVILTNAHVAQFFLVAGEEGKEKSRVTGTCSVRTGSPAKERYTALVLYFPPTWVKENASELKKNKPKGTGENDFALLYVTDAKKGKLPKAFPSLPIDLAGSTVADEAITVAGYPSEKLDFEQIRKSLPMLAASSTVTRVRSFGHNGTPDVLTIAPSAAGSQGISGGPIVDGDGEVLGIVTTKSIAKGDRTLRAITLSYIDRALQSQTGAALASLLSGDFAARASSTSTTISAKTIKTIENGLLKKD